MIVPDVVKRLKKYEGLVKGRDKCPPNPCITVREAIELANYISLLESKTKKVME